MSLKSNEVVMYQQDVDALDRRIEDLEARLSRALRELDTFDALMDEDSANGDYYYDGKVSYDDVAEGLAKIRAILKETP